MEEALDFSDQAVAASEPLDFSDQAEAPADATVASDDKPGALSRGFVTTSLKQNPELMAAALEGMSHRAPELLKGGMTESAAALRNLAKANPKDYETQAGSMVDSILSGEVGTWALEAIGSGVASSVPSLVTGTIGAAVGSRFGKVGTVTGAITGAAGSSYMMGYGEVYAALIDAGVEPEPAGDAAWAAAVPIAALDTYTPGKLLTRLGGVQKVKQEAIRRLSRRLLEEGVKGAKGELITEMTQSVLLDATVSLKTDKPFWTTKNVEGWIEEGVAGALTGGALRGAGGLKRDKVEPGAPQTPPGTQAPPGAPPGTPTPPAAQAPTAPAPEAVNQAPMQGTTGNQPKPPITPGIGNPQSAPKGSPKRYSKTKTKTKTTDAKTGVTNEVVSNVSAEHAIALATGKAPATPVITGVAPAVASPQTVQEVTPEVTATQELPPAQTQQTAPIAPAAPEPVITPEPVVAPEPEKLDFSDQAVAAPVEPPASPEARKPRILPDKTLYAEPQLTNEEAKANTKAASPKEVKAGHRDKKVKAQRVKENTIADQVAKEHEPGVAEEKFHTGRPAQETVARGAILARARQMVAAAKGRGLTKIPKVFAENTDPEMNRNDAQLLLSEAQTLLGVKKPTTDDFVRFVTREKDIRSGNAEIIAGMRSERKAEGEIAKRGAQKAVETVAAPAAVVEEGETETLPTELPEEGGVLPEENVELEKADVQISTKDSDKGARGLDRSQGAASEVRSIPITDEMRAKYNTPAKIPKKTEKLTLKVTPKVAAVKAKAEATKADKPVARVDNFKSKVKKSKDQVRKETISKQASEITGLPITIEKPSGTVRTGRTKDGQPWAVLMKDHYGSIRRTEGADGDPVDVTVGPRLPNNNTVFVIDQVNADTQAFDEHKTFMGFRDAKAATDAYARSFSDGRAKERFGGIQAMSTDEFKTWLKDGDTKNPVTSEVAPDLVEDASRADQIRARIRQITYDRGLTRKAMGDPQFKNPKYENELSKLREELKDIEGDLADPKEGWTEVGTSTEPAPPDFQPGEGRVAYARRNALRISTVSAMFGPARNISDVMGALEPASAPMRAVFPSFMQRIMDIVGDVEVIVVPSNIIGQTTGSSTAAGAYMAGDHVIVLPEHSAGSLRLPYLLLHEGVHAAFVTALARMPEVRRMVDIIAREAKKAGTDGYAFTNPDEFIAEAFSNIAFQRWLANTKASTALSMLLAQNSNRNIGRPVRNLWEALREVVGRALGFEGSIRFTLLDAMMHVGAELEGGVMGGLGGPMTRAEGEARRLDRLALAEKEGSPWKQNYKKAGLNADLMELPGLTEAGARVGDHVAGFQNWLNRSAVAVLNAHHMRMQFEGTVIGPHLKVIEEAAAKMTPMIENFTQGYAVLAQKFFDYKHDNITEAPILTELGLDLTNLSVHMDGDTLVVPGKDNTSGWQARGHLAELQARYDTISPRGKAIFKEMAAFYKEAHNTLVRSSVEALLQPEVLGASLTRAELNAVISRAMEGQLNETDRTLLGDTLYHALDKEGSFRSIKGVYFPRMRYGEHVVTAKDTLDEEAILASGGKLQDDGTVLFKHASDTRARDHARHYEANVLPLRVTRNTKHVYIDQTTGQIVSADEATGLNLVDHGYVVYPQTQAVYFFESRAEAEQFHRNNPNKHSTINKPEDRIGEGHHASVFTGTQMASILKSVEARLPGAENEGQRTFIRSMLTQAAAMQMPGNRITSRRLKSQKVTGASHDFTRNLLNYGDAAARHIANAQAQPAIRRAMSGITEALKGYEGKDRGTLIQVQNELMKRFNRADLARTKPQWLEDLFSITFVRLLGDISYNIVNSTQNLVLGVPILGPKFGHARVGREFFRAYEDMGFGDAVMGGVVNTIRAARQWRSLGLTGMGDLLGRSKQHLAKASDGVEVLAMLDNLEARGGALQATSGFEVGESTRLNRGMWGSSLAKVDRIVRQAPKAVEVINRVAAATTAYRLARSAGYSVEKAWDFTYDSVIKIHGNYDPAVQPRFFNSPLLSPALQFKKYSHIVTYAIGDAAHTAFKGASLEERKVARKQLANHVAVQIALAGALGLPGLELLKLGFMFGAMLGLSDGWGDQEERLRQIAEDALGKTWGELVTSGVISRAIGIDVSKRLSMADLWLAFGEPQWGERTLAKERESIQNWMWNWLTGAAGDTIADTWEGWRLAQDGDFGKALTKLPVPKAVTNLGRAYNREDAGLVERGVNAIGFRTAKQAAESRMWDTRRVLEKDYVRATSPATLARVTARIREHNKKAPPNLRISIKGLVKKRRAAH